MKYSEFQTLMDSFRDHVVSYTIRSERDRPELEKLEAMAAALKAQEELWQAIQKPTES